MEQTCTSSKTHEANLFQTADSIPWQRSTLGGKRPLQGRAPRKRYQFYSRLWRAVAMSGFEPANLPNAAPSLHQYRGSVIPRCTKQQTLPPHCHQLPESGFVSGVTNKCKRTSRPLPKEPILELICSLLIKSTT